MTHHDVVVCSFFTADDYYRAHADSLRAGLADLGITTVLEEIEKPPGADWADICRKKIAFLARVCDEHPTAKVFWIDVDCNLLNLPSSVEEFSADLIGFQRGFSNPMSIGYASRTRFWEPCFFGINATPAGRKFIADAAHLERTLDIKATDDYFFEEAWRANAGAMSFQVIPSSHVIGRGTSGPGAFFSFGASGNVAEFKGKVEQHGQVGGSRSRRGSVLRRQGLRVAKKVERTLSRVSGPGTHRLRRIADSIGITHLLVGTSTPRIPGASRQRGLLINHMIAAGQRGELDKVHEVSEKLAATAIVSEVEAAAQQAAESFAIYASVDPDHDTDPVHLKWWSKPFPGNFGDWLSPLILRDTAGLPVRYVAPTSPSHHPHLVMVGSIGRFIQSSSIVVGTGVSTEDLELAKDAHYVSVRGPVTAQVLRASGGPDVASMGDPGALVSRIIPITLGETNGRIAFVRHFTHANLPVTVPENFDELSVRMSSPEAIEGFLRTLAQYDAVVTSAMHVMIVCHSYGIPCSLVSFEGFESAVHGTGIKYRDYSSGAGLSRVWEPQVVGLNLNRTTWDDMLAVERISEDKLDEISTAISTSVASYMSRIS